MIQPTIITMGEETTQTTSITAPDERGIYSNRPALLFYDSKNSVASVGIIFTSDKSIDDFIKTLSEMKELKT